MKALNDLFQQGPSGMRVQFSQIDEFMRLRTYILVKAGTRHIEIMYPADADVSLDEVSSEILMRLGTPAPHLPDDRKFTYEIFYPKIVKKSPRPAGGPSRPAQL